MRSYQVIPGQTGNAQQYVNLRHDARGAANLLPHQMLGYIALPSNPSNNQTLTLAVNGTNIVFTFVAAIGTAAGNVLIGANAAATALNLHALLSQPQTTTSKGVALSEISQQLLSYLSYSLPSGGTTIYLSSNNTTLYAPLTSFSASTTATGGSWNAQTMQLYVEPGVVYVNGTRVVFIGSSSPTVTAPVSNPRIDLLAVNSSGTLSWTTGAESASPVAPAYPADKVILCELYNVVGEIALYDYEYQQASQGYVYHDVRPLLGTQLNPGAIPDSLIPDADGTRDLGSLSFEWNNVYAKTAVYVNGHAAAVSKFGGTGADGALSISSGTTTINASSAAYLEKNYTSISITGTGNLAFSSPNNSSGTVVSLRSQGNVTITTSSTHAIDMRNMGGGVGSGILSVNIPTSSGGGVGGSGGGSCSGAGTSGGANNLGSGTMELSIGGPALSPIVPMSRFCPPGGNGTTGGSAGANGFSGGGNGTAGLGAGALIIECGGAYNFTTGAIDLSGGTGGNGSTVGGGGTGGGGGGGGAGGNGLVLYFSLTADSGTYNVTGGGGGTGASPNGLNGSAGANGATYRALNNYIS